LIKVDQREFDLEENVLSLLALEEAALILDVALPVGTVINTAEVESD